MEEGERKSNEAQPEVTNVTTNGVTQEGDKTNTNASNVPSSSTTSASTGKSTGSGGGFAGIAKLLGSKVKAEAPSSSDPSIGNAQPEEKDKGQNKPNGVQHHDDLPLGSEAHTLTSEQTNGVVSPSVEPNSAPIQTNHVTPSAPHDKRSKWRRTASQALMMGWQSFNSDASIQTSASSASLDYLLQNRQVDPEQMLLSLGFGGVAAPAFVPSLARVPERFLNRPSQAHGIYLPGLDADDEDDDYEFEEDYGPGEETGNGGEEEEAPGKKGGGGWKKALGGGGGGSATPGAGNGGGHKRRPGGLFFQGLYFWPKEGYVDLHRLLEKEVPAHFFNTEGSSCYYVTKPLLPQRGKAKHRNASSSTAKDLRKGEVNGDQFGVDGATDKKRRRTTRRQKVQNSEGEQNSMDIDVTLSDLNENSDGKENRLWRKAAIRRQMKKDKESKDKLDQEERAAIKAYDKALKRQLTSKKSMKSDGNAQQNIRHISKAISDKDLCRQRTIRKQGSRSSPSLKQRNSGNVSDKVSTDQLSREVSVPGEINSQLNSVTSSASDKIVKKCSTRKGSLREDPSDKSVSNSAEALGARQSRKTSIRGERSLELIRSNSSSEKIRSLKKLKSKDSDITAIEDKQTDRVLTLSGGMSHQKLSQIVDQASQKDVLKKGGPESEILKKLSVGTLPVVKAIVPKSSISAQAVSPTKSKPSKYQMGVSYVKMAAKRLGESISEKMTRKHDVAEITGSTGQGLLQQLGMVAPSLLTKGSPKKVPPVGKVATTSTVASPAGSHTEAKSNTLSSPTTKNQLQQFPSKDLPTRPLPSADSSLSSTHVDQLTAQRPDYLQTPSDDPFSGRNSLPETDQCVCENNVAGVSNVIIADDISTIYVEPKPEISDKRSRQTEDDEESKQNRRDNNFVDVATSPGESVLSVHSNVCETVSDVENILTATTPLIAAVPDSHISLPNSNTSTNEQANLSLSQDAEMSNTLGAEKQQPCEPIEVIITKNMENAHEQSFDNIENALTQNTAEQQATEPNSNVSEETSLPIQYFEVGAGTTRTINSQQTPEKYTEPEVDLSMGTTLVIDSPEAEGVTETLAELDTDDSQELEWCYDNDTLTLSSYSLPCGVFDTNPYSSMTSPSFEYPHNTGENATIAESQTALGIFSDSFSWPHLANTSPTHHSRALNSISQHQHQDSAGSGQKLISSGIPFSVSEGVSQKQRQSLTSEQVSDSIEESISEDRIQSRLHMHYRKDLCRSEENNLDRSGVNDVTALSQRGGSLDNLHPTVFRTAKILSLPELSPASQRTSRLKPISKGERPSLLKMYKLSAPKLSFGSSSNITQTGSEADPDGYDDDDEEDGEEEDDNDVDFDEINEEDDSDLGSNYEEEEEILEPSDDESDSSYEDDFDVEFDANNDLDIDDDVVDQSETDDSSEDSEEDFANEIATAVAFLEQEDSSIGSDESDTSEDLEDERNETISEMVSSSSRSFNMADRSFRSLRKGSSFDQSSSYQVAKSRILSSRSFIRTARPIVIRRKPDEDEESDEIVETSETSAKSRVIPETAEGPGKVGQRARPVLRRRNTSTGCSMRPSFPEGDLLHLSARDFAEMDMSNVSTSSSDSEEEGGASNMSRTASVTSYKEDDLDL